MTKVSSTMLSVGTLLRHAEDVGADVRVLVQGAWIGGRVVGCDGLGAVIDDGEGQQSLVRLDQVAAITFSQAQMDGVAVGSDEAREQGHRAGEPFVAGTVTVPSPSPSGDSLFTPKRR